MATTITGDPPYLTKGVSPSAATATKITVPTWARRVTIHANGAAVKVSHTGTDGVALGSDYETIPDGTTGEIPLAVGSEKRVTAFSFYVQAASGTPRAEIGVGL